MLAAARRVRRREEFAAAIRTGRRAGTGSVVVHLLAPTTSSAEPARSDDTTVARAGFVVPKTVGNAVVRNKVRRRLRHLMRVRLEALPDGVDVVVRALPAASSRTYSELETDLDVALAAARRPRRPRTPRGSDKGVAR
ncbi:ribonuclease P protein component [Luedemannella helvata]|uniref:Ribonuclease P protein component n=1 Tax=Luedemannella helvata TaxID=349315 RepID=A0ABN2L1D7_9ACTN